MLLEETEFTYVTESKSKLYLALVRDLLYWVQIRLERVNNTLWVYYTTCYCANVWWKARNAMSTGFILQIGGSRSWTILGVKYLSCKNIHCEIDAVKREHPISHPGTCLTTQYENGHTDLTVWLQYSERRPLNFAAS